MARNSYILFLAIAEGNSDASHCRLFEMPCARDMDQPKYTETIILTIIFSENTLSETLSFLMYAISIRLVSKRFVS